MIPAEILRKKRDGGTLSSEEISGLVEGIVRGSITPSQAAAFLMAACIRGLDRSETVALTTAMARSGHCYDWQHLGYAVDKHSTGGVGDKVSLLVAPIAAAAGALVPMMSGRGLGHTGGTVDKLESIVGFRLALSDEEIERQLRRLGVVMLAQSERLAPADRILYALRDETGTVESIGLITASILSKKIAEGARGLVLDVKVGHGAFMQRHSDARALALSMQEVAQGAELDVHISLTDMNDPLGYAVGNWVEVSEAERALADPKHCPADIEELTLHLAGAMLQLSGIAASHAEGIEHARRVWTSGQAWERFHALIAAQGGDWKSSLERYRAAATVVIESSSAGFVTGFDTRQIGLLAVQLGAGRLRSSDAIDPVAGIVFHVRRGDRIERGMPLATLSARDERRCSVCAEQLLATIEIESAPPPPRSAIVIETLERKRDSTGSGVAQG